jgi:hypothetical protein
MKLHPIANLATLPDTGITAPQNYDHLEYNSSTGKWENVSDLTVDGFITATGRVTAAGFTSTVGGDEATPGYTLAGAGTGLYADITGDGIIGLSYDSASAIEWNDLNQELSIADGNGALLVNTINSGSIIQSADSDLTQSGTGHVTSGSEGFIVGNTTILSATATIDTTLVLEGGSITDSTGNITFVNENLDTLGIITAGEFNTTGSLGNTGTLASFGVDGAAAASFKGLVEVTTDSSHTLTAGLNAGLLANVAVNSPDISSGFAFGSGSFVTATGELASNDSVIGLFGSVTGDTLLANSVGGSFITGLQFEVTNSADHILSGFSAKKLTTKGLSLTSNFSDIGFETSGTRAVRDNFGADITSNLRGLYNATNDGSNFGVCITVTDSLDDNSTGDITSVGLDVIVPPSSVHGGGGVLTSLAARFGGEVKTEGGRIVNTDRLTSNTTLDITYHRVFCNTDSAGFTVTLPATPTDGQEYRIANTGNKPLVIARNGETIVGLALDVTLNACDIIILTYETTEGWW